ncbi:glycosyltransferase [Cellvibrio sp.]|uniref:glycosyltransferase n=1 Tax=Cellvibrio sp. TaxID=1965322 RepID=UPI0039647BFF
MGIIFYALGTKGDVHPLIGVAAELVRRCFDVTFLSNEYFKQAVEEQGVHFVSTGTVEQYLKGNNPEAWLPNSDNMDNFQYYHAPSFEPAFTYVTRTYANNSNLIVVSHTSNNGAAVAAKKFGIPLVYFTISPNAILSYINPPAPFCWRYPNWYPKFLKRHLLKRIHKESFNKFYGGSAALEYIETRKRLGVPLSYNSTNNPILQLCFFPEWFGMREKDWPDDLKLIGFPLFDSVDSRARMQFDNIISEYGNPIIFAAGSGITEATDFFKQGRAICEALNLPGLFVGGVSSRHVLNGSPLCTSIEYVDFDYALPKCLLIVHHGGIGTLAQAIKAGIPQIIRPLLYDQPDNGLRIEKLSLGYSIFPSLFTAETVAPIVKSLIDYTPFNKKLAAYSADVKRSTAIQKACNLIEQKIKEVELV